MDIARQHMSIGEVLNVLKEEFPDVTVSKIRFLEAEGLVHPERTASGYRKFGDNDVVRLRFILRTQRDHFLPLKVIKDRVAEWEAADRGQATLDLGNMSPEPLTTVSSPPEAVLTAQAEPLLPDDELVFRSAMSTSMSLKLADLSRASSLTEMQLKDLRRFGLLSPRSTGEEDIYTEIDLQVAKLARDLFRLGLEPRHLRIVRSYVDQWVSLAEQMVLPLVNHVNPESRRAASETVRDFARAGNKLMQTLLREALGPYA